MYNSAVVYNQTSGIIPRGRFYMNFLLDGKKNLVFFLIPRFTFFTVVLYLCGNVEIFLKVMICQV